MEGTGENKREEKLGKGQEREGRREEKRGEEKKKMREGKGIVRKGRRKDQTRKQL